MKLLIVEDDRLLSRAVAAALQGSYDVDVAFDGEEGLYYAAQDVYDLVVLDVMLPGRDGFSVLEELRRRGVGTPVLMLTAKGTTADKLRGLRSGADDYLTKPFDRDELLARIEAILRRATGRADVRTIAFEDLVLHTQTKQATIAGVPVPLKGKQYDVLEYLVSHEGSLVSKERLFDKISGISVRNLVQRRGGVRERAAQGAGAVRLRSLCQDHPRGRLPVHGGRRCMRRT